MSKLRFAAVAAALAVAGLFAGFTQAAPTFASPPPPPCSIHSSGGASGTAYCVGNNTSVYGQANGVAAAGGIASGSWQGSSTGYVKSSGVIVTTAGGTAAVTAVTGEDHPVVAMGVSSGTGLASAGGQTSFNAPVINTGASGGGLCMVLVNGIITFCP